MFGIREAGHGSYFDFRRRSNIQKKPARAAARRNTGISMTDLVFNAPQPFQMILVRDASTVAEGESVQSTLPIHAPGFPEDTAQVRLALNPSQAEMLAEDLLRAAQQARKHAGQFEG
jgi:hypothetical protein